MYNENGEFYKFNNKYVRDYKRISVKGGRVCAFKRNFESKQFDEKLLTIKKHLNIHDNEISIVIDEYLEYAAIKEKEYQRLFVGDESDIRKKDKKVMEDFINTILRELPISRDFRQIIIYDLIVSYDFNRLYPSAQADKDST